MARLLIRQIRAALWPAAAVIGLLAVCQAWLRWLYPHAANQRPLQINAFVGWLGILFLAASVAGILWAAGNRAGLAVTPVPDPGKIPPTRLPDILRGLDRGQLFLGYALLLDSCGLYLLAVGTAGRFITFPDAVRIYLLLASWVALWMEFVCLLRRLALPAAPAAAIALGFAMLFFAAPVTLLPLARAVAGRMQQPMVAAIGCATPLLGCFDAMKHSLLVGWAQQPEMYQLSSLGQDIPMALPPWWHNALAYAAIAAFFWCLRHLPRRAPEAPLDPSKNTPQDPAAFSIKK